MPGRLRTGAPAWTGAGAAWMGRAIGLVIPTLVALVPATAGGPADTMAWLAAIQLRIEHAGGRADPGDLAALRGMRTALARRLPPAPAVSASACGDLCGDLRFDPRPSPLLLSNAARQTDPVYLLAARGRLVSGYGEPVGEGARTRGITLQTRPGSTVVAPAAGRLLYAGAFRGYGQVIIIDHGRGWATLLAGVARPERRVGDPVLMGEPIARAGNRLMVELHHGARAVDVVAMIAGGVMTHPVAGHVSPPARTRYTGRR